MFTVTCSDESEPSIAEKATIGLVGGIAGGGLFALTCAAIVGGGCGGCVIAAASVVPIWLGGASGSAVGAGRESTEAAFFSGALAGFAGPSATAAVLGGEFAVKVCTETSQEDALEIEEDSSEGDSSEGNSSEEDTSEKDCSEAIDRYIEKQRAAEDSRPPLPPCGCVPPKRRRSSSHKVLECEPGWRLYSSVAGTSEVDV